MNGLLDRRQYAEKAWRRGGAWRERAEQVAWDIRFFARARRDDGAPFPSWAIDYRPGKGR